MTSYTNIFTGSPVATSDSSFQTLVLTSNISLSWPLSFPENPLVVTMIIYASCSGASYSITLPDARESSTGRTILLVNTGSFAIPVLNNLGATIATVPTTPSSNAYLIILADNSTQAGVWQNIQYGVGTSSPDAASLAGNGLIALNARLNENWLVTNLNTNYTISSTDRSTLLNCAGGNLLVTLPSSSSLVTSPASANGYFFVIYASPTGGQVTLQSSTGATINGNPNFVFNPGDTGIVITDGANWYVVGYGIPVFYNLSTIDIPLTDGTSPLTLNSEQVQYNVQNFSSTGSLTGAYTINYPAIEGVFYINNATSGGQNIIATLGGNSYTIPANGKTILYCDGSNLYNTPNVIPSNLTISQTAGTPNKLLLQTGNNYLIGMQAPTSGSSNINYTLPGAFPATLSNIVCNTSGQMSFTNATSGACKAYRITSAQTITGTLAPVIFQSCPVGLTYYNLTTGIYTVPVAGNYYAATNLNIIYTVSAPGRVLVTTIIAVNSAYDRVGGIHTQQAYASATTGNQICVNPSTICNVNAGDTINILVSIAPVDAITISTAGVDNGFSTQILSWFTVFAISGA